MDRELPYFQTIRGSQGPRLLIVAGVHGDEFEPMAAVRELMLRISSGELRGELRGEVTLVPVANPAAYARGERVAEDGLDLARVCPGRADGPITEQTACRLSSLITAADHLIDLHTGGKLLALVPLAGYMLHTDQKVLDTQRQMAQAFNLPLVWGSSADLQGRTLSVARDAKVPAIYVEHGGGSAFDAAAVDDLVQGCLNVMADLKMISAAPVMKRTATIFEDRRPGSGHLQINYPSPQDGVFAPAVRLGEWMETQQLIGHVVNLIEGSVQDVRATESGTLIMLRATPRVRPGDALATIIPVPFSNGADYAR
jgi:predicted deacylase